MLQLRNNMLDKLQIGSLNITGLNMARMAELEA